MADERTLEQSEAELTSAKEQIGKLRTENAKYRTQRNDALKRTYVLKAVTDAHGIKTGEVLSEGTLAGLSVQDGEVTGDFEYKAPKLTKEAPSGGEQPSGQQQQQRQEPGASATLTMDAIAKMSDAEINKRWDEVSAVLEGQEA